MKRLSLITTLLFASLCVIAQPSITSVSPLTGIPGSTVTITGTGFNTTPANDVVYFGATRATVSAASATSLTVTVPTGATYDYVTVNNTAFGLTAYSGMPFLPTYNNTGFVPGTENFNPGILFQDTANTNEGRAIVDIDGDGKLDVVLLKAHNALAIYRNTSSGGSVSFASPVYFTTGHNPSSIAIGDLDGDGKPDISIGDLDDNEVSVFRNTSTVGSITLGARVAFSCVGFGNPLSIAIADIDGDGRPEIVVGSPEPLHTIQLFRNTSSPGSITTGSFAGVVTYAATRQLMDIVVSDIDGDGKPDICYTSVDSATVSVMRNTSSVGMINSGTLATAVNFSVGNHPFARDLQLHSQMPLPVALGVLRQQV